MNSYNFIPKNTYYLLHKNYLLPKNGPLLTSTKKKDSDTIV